MNGAAALIPGSDGGSAIDADREAARTLLRLEGSALEELAETLDHRFNAALDRLQAIAGRVIVTGIGKSGHVARKMAATFASTGTPSFYVHPSEASHGDLGMVTRADAVLALSNSGNTTELADLIGYARRCDIPLIAITSNVRSPLAEQSDITLVLPPTAEACPHGLAPTTSTTMMMALGDALAIALLRRRGFTTDDYRVLHPGGALGRRLRKVADVMHTGQAMPLAGPRTPMSEALLIMSAKSLGCLGVVHDVTGELIGIVTDGDLRRHMSAKLLEQTAEEIMTARPRTIRPGALIEEALRTMNEIMPRITSLFVVDEGDRPIGLVHMHDCLRAGAV